jgi:hypothetical protein
MIRNDILTSLKSYSNLLDPKIAMKMWRTQYVTHLNPKDKTGVEVTEDYSLAPNKVFQQRLQEFAAMGTKFELSSKVFNYCLPVDVTRSKIEEVVRDLFGAIEWSGGCLIQHQENQAVVSGKTHSLLPWDERGPQPTWCASSLQKTEKNEQKPFDKDQMLNRTQDLVRNHIRRLEKIEVKTLFEIMKPIVSELQQLKAEFADNPEHLDIIGIYLFGHWSTYMPTFVFGNTSSGFASIYKPEGLATYLGIITGLFPFKDSEGK